MSPKTELELRRKIADLEERIRVLEAGPSQRIEYHYHYQYPQPYYIPPRLPDPWWINPVWCGSTGAATSGPHRIQSTATGAITIS